MWKKTQASAFPALDKELSGALTEFASFAKIPLSPLGARFHRCIVAKHAATSIRKKLHFKTILFPIWESSAIFHDC